MTRNTHNPEIMWRSSSGNRPRTIEEYEDKQKQREFIQNTHKTKSYAQRVKNTQPRPEFFICLDAKHRLIIVFQFNIENTFHDDSPFKLSLTPYAFYFTRHRLPQFWHTASVRVTDFDFVLVTSGIIIISPQVITAKNIHSSQPKQPRFFTFVSVTGCTFTLCE